MAINPWYKNNQTGEVVYGGGGGGDRTGWTPMGESEITSFMNTLSPTQQFFIRPGEDYNFGNPDKWQTRYTPNVQNTMVDSQKLSDVSSYGSLGQSVTDTASQNLPQTTDPADLFQPNLYPYSRSNSSSINTSDSFSGLDEATRNKIIESILPNLLSSAKEASGAPQRFEDTATKAYEKQARDAIETSARNVMESMGRRGLMNSSVSEEALRGAISDIARSVGDQRYQTSLDAEQMRLALPSIMSNLMGLGQYSQGGSTGLSTGTSESAQPNVPYENMMNFILGLSPTLVSG